MTGFLDEKQAHRQLQMEKRHLRNWGLVATSDWMPMYPTSGLAWTSQPETFHTALAYLVNGNGNEAWELIDTGLRTLYRSRWAPGNFGAWSLAISSEKTDTDLPDWAIAGPFAEAVVRGLFGIEPRLQDRTVTITPTFPSGWRDVGIKTPVLAYDYDETADTITISARSTEELRKVFRVPVTGARILSVTLNGEPAEFVLDPHVGRALLVAAEQERGLEAMLVIEMEKTGARIEEPQVAPVGDTLTVTAKDATIEEIDDPQGLLAETKLADGVLTARVNDIDAECATVFLLVRAGDTQYWHPIDLDIKPALGIGAGIEYEEHAYYYFITNNTQSSLTLTLASSFLGDEHRETVGFDPGRRAGFAYPLGDALATRVVPGTNPFTVHISGDREETIRIDLRAWDILNIAGDTRCRFRTVDLTDVANADFEKLFHYDYPRGAFDVPGAIYSLSANKWAPDVRGDGLRAGYRWPGMEDFIGKETLEQTARQGVLYTEQGIPFVAMSGESDAVVATLWTTFPNEITIPVGARARKIYFLVAGTQQNMNYMVPNVTFVVHYADGTSQEHDLVPPRNYHHLYHPAFTDDSAEVRLNEHTTADLVELTTDPAREITTITMSAQALDTIVALLGVTLLEPR